MDFQTSPTTAQRSRIRFRPTPTTTASVMRAMHVRPFITGGFKKVLVAESLIALLSIRLQPPPFIPAPTMASSRASTRAQPGRNQTRAFLWTEVYRRELPSRSFTIRRPLYRAFFTSESMSGNRPMSERYSSRLWTVERRGVPPAYHLWAAVFRLWRLIRPRLGTR